jgi:hypothetical protein
MALEDYYEPFHVQELGELPSSADEKIYEFRDGMQVMGIFKQKQSGEMLVADSLGTVTHGRFAANAELASGSFLRRVRDNVFIKLVGDPLQSPPQAITQVRTWHSYVTTRERELQGG